MTRNLRHAPGAAGGVRRVVAAIAVISSVACQAIAIPLHGASALQSTEVSSPEVAEFQKRAQDYVTLHKKVEAGITLLPNEATPAQIDGALTQLSQGIVKARAAAKVGDIFQPAMQAWVRKTLERAFSGPDGKDLRASILDENPIGASVRVNGAYPDSLPLSTMPPKVIEALPRLPEELEFRFVGDRLILFDHHAHLIVDYVDRALPMV